MNYVGEKCPVCGKTFTETDDIAVCPDCGTPHHRDCYRQSGRCANEDRHGSFSWTEGEGSDAKRVSREKRREEKPMHRVVFCPGCGAENPAEEPMCRSCGARLYKNRENGGPSAPRIELPNMTEQSFSRAGLVTISPSDDLGGNTVGDSAEFIGPGAARYIPKLYKLDREEKKASWNWAAFFFSPYWFFYRKLPVAGFVLMLILMLVTACCTTPGMIRASEAFMEAMEAAASFYGGGVSEERLLEVSGAVLSRPEIYVTSAVRFGVHLYAGLFGNLHYKRKVEREVAELKKQAQSPEEYRVLLFRRGGVSVGLLLLSYLGFKSALQVIGSLVTKHIL